MADRIIVVCVVLLAAVYFYATAQIPSLDIGDPLGPKAFPRLLGIALLVAAGMLALEIWRGSKDTAPEKKETAPDERGHYIVIGVVVAWTALYFSVFETLGYVVATTLYLLALTAYFHPGKWRVNIIGTVLFCIGTYVMFNHVLGVNLPGGILPF